MSRKMRMNGTKVLPPIREESTSEVKEKEKITPAERTARWKKRQKNLAPYPNAVRRMKIRKRLRATHPITLEQKRLRRNERDRISDKRRRSLAKLSSEVISPVKPSVSDPDPKLRIVDVSGRGNGEPRVRSADRYDGTGTLERLAKLSLTDKQIAEVLGVTERMFAGWRRRHPKIRDAIKRGRGIADSKVAESLFKMAVGYTVPERKTHTNSAGHTTVIDTEKYYPPNPVAAFFWLKNRQHENWRDKKELETTGGPGIVAQKVQFVVVKGDKSGKANPDKIIDADYQILEPPKKGDLSNEESMKKLKFEKKLHDIKGED